MEVSRLEAVVKALNDAQVNYVIVGGVAVNAYGFVRMTRDLNLVIELKESNIIKGLKALTSIGYQMSIPSGIEEFADSQTRERWRNERNMIVLKMWSDVHQRTPIDIFIYELFAYSDEEA